MGLFDRFKKAVKNNGPMPVTPIEVNEKPNGVYAPLSGRIVPLADVPDPVFSTGGLGKGCGIEPGGKVVYSPVSGTISALIEKSRHAVGISGDDGAELLIHVGIDTVSMEGDGFEYLVKEKQQVKAGQPLMRFNAEKIEKAGHEKTVLVVVTNSDDLSSVELAASGNVKAGEKIIEVTR